MKTLLISKRPLRAANLARDARQWGEARLNYELALAQNPELDAIWVQLGHACKEMGDLPAAQVAYERALTLKPDVYDTHVQLGHLFKLMAQTNLSVRAYARATELRPGPSDATNELARLGLAPDCRWAFVTRLSSPSAIRSGQGSMWFTLHAVLEGMAAPDLLRLHVQDGLQLSCALYAGLSTLPALQTGTAQLSLLNETTLRCRFVLHHEEAIGALPLARVGFHYGEYEDCKLWRDADAWMALDVLDNSLGQLYRSLSSS